MFPLVECDIDICTRLRAGYAEMVRFEKCQPIPIPGNTCGPNPRVDPVPVSNPSSKATSGQLPCTGREYGGTNMKLDDVSCLWYKQ
jgi:hypothetical protein